jgi:hypothetical protein
MPLDATKSATRSTAQGERLLGLAQGEVSLRNVRETRTKSRSSISQRPSGELAPKATSSELSVNCSAGLAELCHCVRTTPERVGLKSRIFRIGIAMPWSLRGSWQLLMVSF